MTEIEKILDEYEKHSDKFYKFRVAKDKEIAAIDSQKSALQKQKEEEEAILKKEESALEDALIESIFQFKNARQCEQILWVLQKRLMNREEWSWYMETKAGVKARQEEHLGIRRLKKFLGAKLYNKFFNQQ